MSNWLYPPQREEKGFEIINEMEAETEKDKREKQPFSLKSESPMLSASTLLSVSKQIPPSPVSLYSHLIIKLWLRIVSDFDRFPVLANYSK